MKHLLLLSILLSSSVFAEELQVKSKSFYADENKGISIFSGERNVIRSNDELNASKVVIHTNKDKEPVKFVATGKTSFVIFTQNDSEYRGQAEKVIYFPIKKEYNFFKNVHLLQIDEKKEIIGEEVILKTIEGKAYAKSSQSEPVIMIFNLPESSKK